MPLISARHLIPALLAATSLMSGCAARTEAVGPVPGLTAPAEWSESDAKLPWPAADWWGGFGSPELISLLDEARKANADLAASAARLVQADARARSAGAVLLPTIGASAGLVRQESGQLGDGSASSIGRTGVNAGLSASYELDFWGGNQAAADSAAASAMVSRLDQETVALTVTASVANAFFQLLSLRDRLRSAADALTLAERVMTLVDARYRNGAATALEVAQQRNVLVAQRAAIPNLQQQVVATQNSLAVLLGRTPDRMYVAADGLGGLGLPQTGAGVPSDLLDRRPDLKAASTQLVAAGADIRAARAALYPTATLNLSGTLSAAGLSALVNTPTAVANLGLSLAQSLFDGGRRQAQVEIATARRVELVENYRKAILTGYADVETALGAATNAREQRLLQEQAVILARDVFRLAETRYREGATDLLVLLDAQRSLLSQQDQLTQVRLSELQAAVALYRALGGGWGGSAA